MNTLYDVIRRPLVTEKATILQQEHNQVVTEVALWATKNEIKLAAEKLLGVGVVSVRTAICRGKMKRVGKSVGKRRNLKKAFITLKEGADVDVFGVVAGAVPDEEEKK